MNLDQRTALNERIEHLRATMTFEQFLRRAIANRVQTQWSNQVAEESDRRRAVLDAIMSDYDYEVAQRYIVTPEQRLLVRDALGHVPSAIRAELTHQSELLGTQVMSHLGADPRRRMAEIRCWIIDAVADLDALDFYGCRELLAKAVHQLEFMLNHLPQNDRPSRNRLEYDHLLRERVQQIAQALRRHVRELRDVAA